MGFSHFLAEQLHMTVARMEAEMSNAEYVRWRVFYARRAQQNELAEKMARHR